MRKNSLCAWLFQKSALLLQPEKSRLFHGVMAAQVILVHLVPVRIGVEQLVQTFIEIFILSRYIIQAGFVFL